MNATIQARADYRSKFGTYRYRIDIVDATSPTQNIREYEVTPAGAVVTYEGDEENAFQPIIPTKLEWTLVCTTQTQVNFLRTVAQSDSGRYGVRLLRANGNTAPVQPVWVGTILADQLVFQDSLPQYVTLTATDDLGYLQEKPYLDSNGNRFEGVASITEHITNCIGLLRTTWYWDYFQNILGTDYYNIAAALAKNLIPGNYASAGGSVDLYDESRINHTAFHETEENGKAKSAYYVLEEIAKHFNAQFFFTYEVVAPRLVLQPVGTQVLFADDGTQAQGFTYRRDNTVYSTSALTIASQDINNTNSQKRRLAGGQFSYAMPYSEVTRTLKYKDGTPLFSKVFNNSSDFYTEHVFNIATETGDRFRISCPFSIFWGGISADTLTNIQNLNQQTPDNYHIGRIRLRMKIRFEKSGNDLFYKRGLTGGSQVPIFQTYGTLTASDLPVYYTNLYPNVQAAWDADGSEDFYVIVSEPFDVTVDQWLQVPFDFVTDELPNDCTAIGVEMEATYLLPNNSNLVSASLPSNNAPASNNYLTNSTTCSIYGSLRVFPFSDYGLAEEQIVTATNSEDNRQSLDLGDSFVNDKALSSTHSYIEYRQGNGTYQANVIGYTSLLISSSQLYAGSIAVSEAAGLYKRANFVYEGSLIDFYVGFNDVLAITDGTTDYKLKPLTLEVNTGEEVTQVTAMQIAKESSYAVATVVDGGLPMPDTPAPSTTAVRSIQNQVAEQAVQFTPAAAAYAEELETANRGGQTGNRLVLVNSSGKFTEIADGTAGQFLKTNGSGVLSFTGTEVYIAALSARVSTLYLNNYYYGNSSYGWNYPIWSSITFNNQQGNPYARNIPDDYAHCGILCMHDMSSVDVSGTIRNDSSTDNLNVILMSADRPDGSSSNMVGTVVGSTDVTITTQDRHVNFSIDGGSVARGKLLFLGISRTAGIQTTRYINFSATINGTF